MLFWLFVVIFILALLLGLPWKYGKAQKWLKMRSYSYGSLPALSCVVMFFSAATAAIMLFFIVGEHSTQEVTINRWNEERQAIVVKVESGLYADEIGILDKLVVDEIRDYNKKVLSAKILQDNFWVGIFYADIYDQFETIDYGIVPTRES